MIKKIFYGLIIMFFLILAGLGALIYFTMDNTPAPTYDVENFDFQDELEQKTKSSLLMAAFGKKEVVIEQELLNKQLYIVSEDLSNEMSFEESYYSVDFESMWIEINNNSITYKLKGKADISNFKYETIAKLRFDFATEDEEIVLKLKEAKLGKVKMPVTLSKKVLEYLEENNHFSSPDVDNINVDVKNLKVTMAVEDFNIFIKELTENNIPIDINEVLVNDNYFVLKYIVDEESEFGSAMTDALAEAKNVLKQQEFKDKIENITSSSTEGQEFNSKLSALTNKLENDNEDAITDEEQKSFNESFEKMDKETQQAVLDELENSMDPEIIKELESLFK